MAPGGKVACKARKDWSSVSKTERRASACSVATVVDKGVEGIEVAGDDAEERVDSRRARILQACVACADVRRADGRAGMGCTAERNRRDVEGTERAADAEETDEGSSTSTFTS